MSLLCRKSDGTSWKEKVKLTKAASKDEFAKGENVFFYDEAPDLNRFATKGSEFEKTVITKNPQLLVKLGATDITANTTTLRIEDSVLFPKTAIGSLPNSGSSCCPGYCRQYGSLYLETDMG